MINRRLVLIMSCARVGGAGAMLSGQNVANCWRFGFGQALFHTRNHDTVPVAQFSWDRREGPENTFLVDRFDDGHGRTPCRHHTRVHVDGIALKRVSEAAEAYERRGPRRAHEPYQ
jgi:hypothetical protein